MALTSLGQAALNALKHKEEENEARKQAKLEKEARTWAEERAQRLVIELEDGNYNLGDNLAVMHMNGSMLDEGDQLKLKLLDKELGVNLSVALTRDSMDSKTHYMGIIYKNLLQILQNA